jgi:hypothetical protein
MASKLKSLGKNILTIKKPQIDAVKQKHLPLYVNMVIAVLKREKEKEDSVTSGWLYIEQVKSKAGIGFWGTAQAILKKLYDKGVIESKMEAGRRYYRLK